MCCNSLHHPESLLNHLNNFHRGMFKLHAKFDADSLLYLLSHFECNGCTVHMLTQRHLPPPLTSTVNLSLLTHAHSSPLSLAARFHRCHTNCSRYINNGWTFSGQTSYSGSISFFSGKHLAIVIFPRFFNSLRKKGKFYWSPSPLYHQIYLLHHSNTYQISNQFFPLMYI